MIAHLLNIPDNTPVRYVLLLLLTLWCTSLQAETTYRDTCYSIRAGAGYAYNIVYGHYGEFDAGALLPLNAHFEGEINLHASTANTYALGLRMQPKFPIIRNGKNCGAILVETHLLYNLYLRNRIHGLAAAFMVGYRWDYIYAKVGYGLTLASNMDLSPHSSDNGIFEPHNLVYYVEISVRPHSSPWNLSVGITDMTEYQMERMFTPIFFAYSYVDLSPRWRLMIVGLCKPVGIANMAPSFFGAEGKIGAMYKF